MPRKQYLVQKNFQIRYLTYVVGFVFFFVVTITLALYLGIHKTLQKEFSDESLKKEIRLLSQVKIVKESPEYVSRGLDSNLFQNPDLIMNYQKRVLANILTTTNIILVVSLAAILPILALVSVFLSHRIFGSLDRMKKAIRDIGEGDLVVDIRLRERDDMKEFAEDLSFMVRRIRERVKGIRDRVDRLEKSHADFAASPEASRFSDKERIFLRMWAGELKELSKILSEFRIGVSDVL